MTANKGQILNYKVHPWIRLEPNFNVWGSGRHSGRQITTKLLVFI